jgi:L-rhamnose mutarotase
MQEHPVNARWQAEMAPFFESLELGAADASMAPLEEVFHLD